MLCSRWRAQAGLVFCGGVALQGRLRPVAPERQPLWPVRQVRLACSWVLTLLGRVWHDAVFAAHVASHQQTLLPGTA